jgi:hypothetical protein
MGARNRMHKHLQNVRCRSAGKPFTSTHLEEARLSSSSYQTNRRFRHSWTRFVLLFAITSATVRRWLPACSCNILWTFPHLTLWDLFETLISRSHDCDFLLRISRSQALLETQNQIEVVEKVGCLRAEISKRRCDEALCLLCETRFQNSRERELYGI